MCGAGALLGMVDELGAVGPPWEGGALCGTGAGALLGMVDGLGAVGAPWEGGALCGAGAVYGAGALCGAGALWEPGAGCGCGLGASCDVGAPRDVLCGVLGVCDECLPIDVRLCAISVSLFSILVAVVCILSPRPVMCDAIEWVCDDTADSAPLIWATVPDASDPRL